MQKAHTNRRLMPILAVVGFTVLCGATPVPEGTEVSGAVGGGHYTTTGGCGSRYAHSVPEVIFQGEARGRISPHVTWEAELAVGSGRVDEVRSVDGAPISEAPYPVGTRIQTGMSAVRIGYAGEFVGISAGVGGLLLGPEYELPVIVPAPSATAWFGDPETFYLWGRHVSGPLTGSGLGRFRAAGFGRQGERVGLEAGIGYGLQGTASVRLSDTLWLGVDLYSSQPFEPPSQAENQGMLRLTWRDR